MVRAGAFVNAGDVVIADEVGVCVVPHAEAAGIVSWGWL